MVIHPLSDNRRTLTIDKKGETVRAHPDFLLMISYNPGYQSVLIYAAWLIRNGISVHAACRSAICLALTDDPKLQETLGDLTEDIF